MPHKQTLYPKTRRVGSTDPRVIITEKLDGSNIGFFKFEDELCVAQRNWVFDYSEIMKGDVSKRLYKGLYGWIEMYGEHLQEELQDNACVFGEWIGMGKLVYPDLDKRFYQFAKCNIETLDDPIWSTKNLYYDSSLFKWSYKSQEQPDYIGTVPLVEVMTRMPDKAYLDGLYDAYCEKVNRRVEGFITLANNKPQKYVRMKNGTLTPHKS